METINLSTILIVLSCVIGVQIIFTLLRSVIGYCLVKKNERELEKQLQESEERIRQILQEMDHTRRELNESAKRFEVLSSQKEDPSK